MPIPRTLEQKIERTCVRVVIAEMRKACFVPRAGLRRWRVRSNQDTRCCAGRGVLCRHQHHSFRTGWRPGRMGIAGRLCRVRQRH